MSLPSRMTCNQTQLRHKATGELWTVVSLGSSVCGPAFKNASGGYSSKIIRRTSGIEVRAADGRIAHYFVPEDRRLERRELAKDFEDPAIQMSADCYQI